jgi:eight-cysteine-cluster-containing protein
MSKTFAWLPFASLLALAACHSTKPSKLDPEAQPPTPAAECVRSGCSGTVCVPAGKEVVTTCEYKPEYACYDQAKCEKQAAGECGWTRSADFDACMAAGGPKQ